MGSTFLRLGAQCFFGSLLILMAAAAYAFSPGEGADEKRVLIFAPDKMIHEISFSVPRHMVVLQLESSDFSSLQVRTFSQGAWMPWRHVIADETNDIDPGSHFSAPIFFAPFQKLQIQSSHEMRATLFAYQLQRHSTLEAQAGVGDVSVPLRIISRAGWNADESLRYARQSTGSSISDSLSAESSDEKSTSICAPLERAFPEEFRQLNETVYSENGNTLIWPISYSQKIQKIVVHHTAGEIRDVDGDGQITSRDYAMQVQGIYRFHTVSRGWGDIGYNFLIDPLGNVYEGRSGRQTGRMPAAAHVLCQNTGTIGIALLGNFETQSIVPTQQKKSLSMLIGRLSQEYRLNISNQSMFRGEMLPAILGHRDVGAITRKYIGTGSSSCPGSFLYASLDSIIVEARRYQNPEYAIEFQDLPSQIVLVPGFSDGEVSFSFRNTGTKELPGVVVRLSNGLEAEVGDMLPGSQARASFAIKGGMNSMKENLIVRVYYRSGRLFKMVDASSPIAMTRERGFVQVTGSPAIVGGNNAFYAGTSRLLILRYPIVTNANLPAGYFRIAPYGARSRSYAKNGVSTDAISPQDTYVDIPVVFDVSANVPRSAGVNVVLQLSSQLGKIQALKPVIRILHGVDIAVRRPDFNPQNFMLANSSASFSAPIRQQFPLRFAIQTSDVPQELLQAMSSGNLMLRLSATGTTVKLADTEIPFALAEDGRTLVAETSITAARRVMSRVRGALLFGSQQIESLSGANGFQWQISFASQTAHQTENL